MWAGSLTLTIFYYTFRCIATSFYGCPAKYCSNVCNARVKYFCPLYTIWDSSAAMDSDAGRCPEQPETSLR